MSRIQNGINLKPFFKPKLKPIFFLLNCHPVLEVESGVGVLDGEALGVEGEEEGDEEVDEEGPEVLPGSAKEL